MTRTSQGRSVSTQIVAVWWLTCRRWGPSTKALIGRLQRTEPRRVHPDGACAIPGRDAGPGHVLSTRPGPVLRNRCRGVRTRRRTGRGRRGAGPRPSDGCRSRRWPWAGRASRRARGRRLADRRTVGRRAPRPGNRLGNSAPRRAGPESVDSSTQVPDPRQEGRRTPSGGRPEGEHRGAGNQGPAVARLRECWRERAERHALEFAQVLGGPDSPEHAVHRASNAGPAPPAFLVRQQHLRAELGG